MNFFKQSKSMLPKGLISTGISLVLLFTISLQSQAIGIRVHSKTDASVTIFVTSVINYCATKYGIEIKYYVDGALREPDVRIDDYPGDEAVAIFDFDTPGESHSIYATARFTGFWCDYEETSPTLNVSLLPLKSPINVSASDQDYATSIVLTWEGATDFDDAAYAIYRNDPQQHLATISDKQADGSYKYTHSGLSQGSNISYTIYTRKSGKSSTGVSESGSTFDFEFSASDDDPQKVNLMWVDATPLLGGGKGYTVHRVEDGIEYPVHETALNGSTTCQDKDPLVPGYNYTYKLRTVPNSDAIGTTTGRLLPDGFISGTVKTPPTVSDPEGVGIPGVRVRATRQGNVPTDTTSAYHAYTNEDGEYTIGNIYYNEECTFDVAPSLEGHRFDPAEDEVTLILNGTHNVSGIDFTDTSSFVVSGTILQETPAGLCPVPGVHILLDGEETGITTDASGTYGITVNQANDYTIKPYLENHLFEPEEVDLLVTGNTGGIDFTDTTAYLLEGYLSASCNIYIGQASLGFYSLDGEACFSDTVTTDAGTGFYSIELPARDYRVEVLSFTSADEGSIPGALVMAYFTPDTFRLYQDDNLDFVYRLKPELSMEGLDEYISCGTETLPVLEQYKEYVLDFGITESFGDDTCPADTGYIVVEQTIENDDISTDTIYFSQGTASMSLVPGEPNIIAPYEKWIRAIVHLDRQSDTIYQKVLVVGYKPREGKPFTTVTPSLPFHIVHDPPGDESYSYLEKNTSIENSMSVSTQTSTGGKVWVKQKIGLAFSVEAGVGIDFAVWAEYFPSIEITADWIDNHNLSFTMTHSQAYQTSDNPEIVGEGGDVFIGGAMNMLYTLTDALRYNYQTCQVEKKTEIVVIPQGFRTTFMYTENHIKNSLIPDMTKLLDHYLETGDDSASFIENQLSVWQQMIDNNKRNIASAELVENISFSSGAEYESFIEKGSTRASTYEFKMAIDERVAVEAGFEFAGTGMSGGVEGFFRQEIGKGETSSQTRSHKTGYKLKDGNTGDFFSVDVLNDPVYGTPAFRLMGGRSSCPWEPGTQPREGVQLLADSYAQTIEESDGEAVFRLQMGNLSASDEDVTYNLVFDQSSNPDGAVLTISGSPVIGNVPYPYNIPAGGSVDATITVKKGPLASTYNDLRFVLKSACDDAISDDVHLDVNFPGQCGGISLRTKEISPMVNLASEGKVTLIAGDYDASMLESLAIQVCPAGTYAWTTVISFPSSTLTEAEQEIPLSFSDREDGLYNIRATVVCSGDVIYSEVIDLPIDLTPPALFGIPQPSSGILDSAQNISLAFTEDIDCSVIADSCISMSIVNAGANLDYSLGCSENILVMIPSNPAAVRSGDEIRVEVLGITDLAGNMLADTITWTFLVPDASVLQDDEQGDYDFDGIENGSDNCLLTANPGQEDLDEDGEGDLCDDDIDGDGVLNEDDNCARTYNPGQGDSDNDGIGDACETSSDDRLILPGMEINIYPNPVHSEFMCELTVLRSSKVSFELCSMTGQLIHIWKGKEYTVGSHEKRFQTEGMNPGIYLLRIKVDDMVYIRSLVKM